MMAWISVSYFGQMQKIFFLQLALTATVATFAMEPVRKKVPIRKKERSPSLRDLIGASQRGS